MKHIMGPQSTSTLSNVQEGDVQPNAVDLRVGNIFLIRPSTFTITEDMKTHRGSVALKPGPDGFYVLTEGHYEVVMENIIEVGEGEAGWVVTRSTLNRNGVFLTSGLYDTGYHGVMAAVMHVTCGPMRIKKGTRVGQYLSFNAESLHKYDGSYGVGKSHDSKYEAAPTPTINFAEFTQAPKITMFDVQPVAQPHDLQEQEQTQKRGRGRPKKVV